MNPAQSAILKILKSPDLLAVQARLGGAPETWSIDEIGDGNVNLIFHVRGPLGQVLVKQAVPYLRCVGESWPLSVARSFFEYTTFCEHGSVAADYLPEIYFYSPDSSCLVMEFLGSHLIVRKGLIQGLQYPRLAEHIAEYMARTLFFTSDLYLSAAEKKKKIKLFCDNTDLCKITEDLIFTDPYRDSKQNHWTQPGLDRIVAEFQSDDALKLAITEMKGKFLTSTEALIHGDLHSGSIMANQSETKVIDPEFAFYGPMGFDVGLLLGNFLLAYFSQAGLGADERDRLFQETWLLEQIQQIWDKFSSKFSALWETDLRGDYLSPHLFSGPNSRSLRAEFRLNYLSRLFLNSVRFGAAEMIRRILGLAHVEDMDAIADPDRKAICEYRALKAAYQMLVHSDQVADIPRLIALAKKIRQLKINA